VNEIPEPALVNSHPTEVVHEANTPPHIERFRSLYQNKTTSTVSDPPAPKTPPQKTVSSKPAVNYAQSFQAWKQVVQRWLQKVMLSLWTLTQVLLKHKKILLITLGGLLVVGGLSFWFLRFAPQQETSNSQTPSPSPSVATTPLSATNTLQPESSLTLNKELVALAFLENQGYGATSNSIIALDTKEEFSVPDIKGEIRFLAPMADLRLLFILTSQNELFAWSPLAKTFTKQELSLPLNARVTGIGTYLTYLYVLDRGNNQLYRYPRSTPGFTESTNWMKESFELTDTAYLAINETVALAPSREHLLAFSQGKTTGDFVFQNPEAPINIQALTTDSDFPFMYALGENSVLSIWNLDRKLLHTYTLKEAPEDALYLATDPEKNILLVGNKKGTVTRYTNVQSE
jgi:hypothetical protein